MSGPVGGQFPVQWKPFEKVFVPQKTDVTSGEKAVNTQAEQGSSFTKLTMLYFRPKNLKGAVVPSLFSNNKKLQAYSYLYDFVIIDHSNEELAKSYNITKYPSAVFVDSYGNVYNRLASRFNPNNIIAAFDTHKAWNEINTRKFNNLLEKVDDFEEKQNRKATITTLVKIVDNKEGIIGLEPVEEATIILNEFLNDARTEVKNIADNYSKKTAKESNTKLDSIAKTYSPLKEEIQILKKDLASRENEG